MDWHIDDLGDEHTPWFGLIVGLSDPSTYAGGQLEIEGAPSAKRLMPGEGLVIPGHRWHRNVLYCTVNSVTIPCTK